MLFRSDSFTPAPTSNIVQLAQATPSLSILVEAVIAADLVATLSGPGPFTVFAPNNDAFAALLTELGVTKAALLANKTLLTTVLTYHVLGAKVEKAGIPIGKKITSLQKSIFKIDTPAGGALSITDGRNRNSKIIATDIQATNGVVHVIDKVILPADKTIVQTAVALAPEFSTLVAAVTAAGLGATLSGTGPFTVFAPTNAAFEKLPAGTVETLLKPENKATLTSILTYHVIAGKALKADKVVKRTSIKTAQGGILRIVVKDGKVMVNNAQVVATDIVASNGVIHVIDAVLIPKMK